MQPLVIIQQVSECLVVRAGQVGVHDGDQPLLLIGQRRAACLALTCSCRRS